MTSPKSRLKNFQDLFAAGHEPLKPSEGIDPLEASILEVDPTHPIWPRSWASDRNFQITDKCRRTSLKLVSGLQGQNYAGNQQSTGLESLPMSVS